MAVAAIAQGIPVAANPRWHGRHRLTQFLTERDGTPKVPFACRVRLHDQPTGRLVREIWTVADGSGEFTHLPVGKYYAVAIDHTRQYAPVAESDLVPEVMPWA